ncbi:MAG: hypothetical protein NDJ94_04725 [Vicinamibacteria bacterium]|nr:hypothetical protein [Vicinamibacteria bacterium]
MKRLVAVVSLFATFATPVAAWPSHLVEPLQRDARRLVPRTLAQLLKERETQILEEARRFPPELVQALATDLSRGALSDSTAQALDARAAEAEATIKAGRLSEGLIQMGALLRIAADLSDPALVSGPSGFPAGVTGEYYAFVERSLPKIPVVLDDRTALKLPRQQLALYWQKLAERSRQQAPVLRAELWKGGRLISQRTIDYRNPLFGVASLSYSRAVTAIAATWLALWREVKGDVTRQPATVVVAPRAGAGE